MKRSLAVLIHTGLQPGGKTFTLLRNRFNGFRGIQGKPLKRFPADPSRSGTGLKPGVNEKTLVTETSLEATQ